MNSDREIKQRIDWVFLKSRMKRKLEKIYPAEEPVVTKINLRRLCELDKHPEYYQPICNTMLKQIFEDPEGPLAEHIYLSETGILFDRLGLNLWRKLLSGYFDEALLNDLTVYLFSEDESARIEFEFQMLLQKASRNELKSYLEYGWMTNQNVMNLAELRGLTPDDMAYAETHFKHKVKAELKRRISLKTWLRVGISKLTGHGEGVYMQDKPKEG